MKILAYILFVALNLNGGDSLKSKINDYLKDKLLSCESYEFEIISAPRESENNIYIDANREFKINSNLAYVPLIIVNSKNIKKNSYAVLKVRVLKKVLVSSSYIQRNENIDENNAILEIVDVAQVDGNTFSAIDELANLQSRVSIKPGSILVSGMFSGTPLIKRGEKINAFVSQGNVRIGVEAFAREDGTKGQIIRILSRDNKIFRAKVIDSNTVQIIE